MFSALFHKVRCSKRESSGSVSHSSHMPLTPHLAITKFSSTESLPSVFNTPLKHTQSRMTVLGCHRCFPPTPPPNKKTDYKIPLSKRTVWSKGSLLLQPAHGQDGKYKEEDLHCQRENIPKSRERAIPQNSAEVHPETHG